MQTPDYLIGVGEGGSRAVESVMDRDWVIEYIIQSDEESEVGDQLYAMTIDSAEDEISERRGKEAEISSNIVDIYENYYDDTAPPYPARENFDDDQKLLDSFQSAVSFKHYNFSSVLADHEYDRDGLTTRDNIRNHLADAPALNDVWWLENHDDLVAEGLQSGVERRRTLSKALYQISSGANDPNHPKDQIAPGGGETVTIVVSLGGGTGSGTLLDLANDIHTNQPDASIDLIGILPDTQEDIENTTNAHAALSELEFLAMANESPFRTMTLIPYSNGRKGTDDRDFEHALADTILANSSMLSTDEGEGAMTPLMGSTPSINLLPFNIAIPHIVQFDPEIKGAAKDNIEEFISQRKTLLSKESQVYETIERYLENNFPRGINEGGTALSNYSSDSDDLPDTIKKELYRMIERIETLHKNLSDDQFEVAGYKQEVEYIREKLLNQYNGALGLDLSLEDLEGSIPESIDADELEYAPQVISGFTSDNNDFEAKTASAENPHIYEYVVEEIDNIEKRDKLLGRLYETNNSGDATNMDENTYRLSEEDIYDNFDETLLTTTHSRLLRTILTEDVLNPNREKLSTADQEGSNRDQQLDELVDRVWDNLHEKELEYQQLTIFEDEVMRYLEEKLADSKNEHADNLETIITFHEYYPDIAKRLDDLDSWASGLEDDLNNHQEPPSNPEYPEYAKEELEQKLEQFGRSERIGTPFNDADDLIDALQHKNNYSLSDYSPIGKSEKQEEFESISKRLNSTPGTIFRINSDFKEEFDCSYSGKYSTIEDNLKAEYNNAVREFVSSLKSSLAGDRVTIGDIVEEDESELKRTTIDKLEDRGRTRESPARLKSIYDDISSTNIEVPIKKTDAQGAIDDIESQLYFNHVVDIKNREIESESELEEYLGFDLLTDRRASDIFENDPSNLDGIKRLIYLTIHPIRDEIDAVQVQLDQYGRNYTASGGDSEGNEGLYDALGRLFVLAEERVDASLNPRNNSRVELGADIDVRYGPDLTADYEITFIGEPDIPTDYPQNPLVKTISAKTKELKAEPVHIGESGIWENRKSQIVALLEASIDDLSGDIRVPVNLSLQGTDNLKPKHTDLIGNTFSSLNACNMYLSRAFNETRKADDGPVFGSIQQTLEYELEGLLDEGASYYSGQLGHGESWTISMVTFLSAISLDMISPDRERNVGYKAKYETATGSLTYEWKHHTLGLDGNWTSWESIERFIDETDQPEWWGEESGGAFINRNSLLETSEAAEFPERTERDENPEVDFNQWDTVRELYQTDADYVMAEVQSKIAEESRGGLSMEQARGIFLSRYDVTPVKSRYSPD